MQEREPIEDPGEARQLHTSFLDEDDVQEETAFLEDIDLRDSTRALYAPASGCRQRHVLASLVSGLLLMGVFAIVAAVCTDSHGTVMEYIKTNFFVGRSLSVEEREKCADKSLKVCWHKGNLDPECCAPPHEGDCGDGYLATMGSSCGKGKVKTCCKKAAEHPAKKAKPAQKEFESPLGKGMPAVEASKADHVGRSAAQHAKAKKDSGKEPSALETSMGTLGNDSSKATDHSAVGCGPEDPECEQDLSSETIEKVLTSYWDIGDCGQWGSDLNSARCGGHKDPPECPESFRVAPNVCASGTALLMNVEYANTSWYMVKSLVQKRNCSFMYYAQYSCHTTTTTTTTTTSTTTTTITTTSTTTTWETDAMFKHRVKHRYPIEEGLTCSKFCPHCKTTFEKPNPGWHVEDLSGVQLPDVCFQESAEPNMHHVFVIGDWGGIIDKDGKVSPADHRKKDSKFTMSGRLFIIGIDDQAQQLVAQQMQSRASWTHPDYVLNVGDNFYWAGLDGVCGVPANQVTYSKQFEVLFEDMYKGPGLDGKHWLGVLGNHDYGGYKFDAAWDQIVSYSWGQGGRWLTPALYWRVKVYYPGFSVDYFFVDTNVWDALPGQVDPEHNICSFEHNKKDAHCANGGPANVGDCHDWFQRLWEDQVKWLESGLDGSVADWQIVVTHFPPWWGSEFWAGLCYRYGVDMIVAGHQHNQMFVHEEETNLLKPTAVVVSGGGGGITSEACPDPQGHDFQYGFFDLTFTKGEIRVQIINHAGREMMTTYVTQRPRGPTHDEDEGKDLKK